MRRASLALLLVVAITSASRADTIVLDGVAFSAEHDGLRLVDGWGRGSRGDPFVLVEEITGDGAAILTVRDLATRFGQRAFIGTGMGFVLEKVVTNRTRRPWRIFEMELREALDQPSDYFDGLSFAQAGNRELDVASDRFARVDLHDEPADRLAFSGTTIAPGETVTVRVSVTDHSPIAAFYLIQRRDAPLAAIDER